MSAVPVSKKVVRQKVVPELEPEQEQVESPASPSGTRQHREVTAESLDADFTQLCDFLEAEIGKYAESKAKGVKSAQTIGGVKFLRSVLKRSRQLQHDSQRLAKKKRKAPRQGDFTNCGFMKPTLISDALAKFLHVPKGSMIGRTECTRKIQEYIIANNLKNPANGREIFPDKVLTKLLGYNSAPIEDGGHGPLSYCRIQQLIQPHFAKAETIVSP